MNNLSGSRVYSLPFPNHAHDPNTCCGYSYPQNYYFFDTQWQKLYSDKGNFFGIEITFCELNKIHNSYRFFVIYFLSIIWLIYIPLLVFDISIWSLSPNFLWRYINIWHLFAQLPYTVPWSCGVAVALLCDNSTIDPDYAYYQWGSAPQGEQGHRGWGWKGGSPSNIPLEGGSGTHHRCKYGFIFKW